MALVAEANLVPSLHQPGRARPVPAGPIDKASPGEEVKRDA